MEIGMDQICIKDLELFGHHGVFPEEKKLGQKFLITATLFTDARKAGLSDDLGHAIDYEKICNKIKDFWHKNNFDLIEAAAEQLAGHLLLTTPGLEQLELEIKKPWASMGFSIETVSVKIHRGWHKAYLSLGSNLGNREGYLNQAVKKLEDILGCRVEKVSSWIETKPYGGVEQAPFLNGCLQLSTILVPNELLSQMQKIEQEAGRERVIHWGPRTLDLDMLFYDKLVTEGPDLLLPHPDMENREFVLEPLMEIAPFLRHPINGKTVKTMLKEVQA